VKDGRPSGHGFTAGGVMRLQVHQVNAVDICRHWPRKKKRAACGGPSFIE
jgi:hypothetical protein